MFLISQIIRFIACIFSIIADASLDKKRMNIFNGISNFITAISYFMLNALTGAIGCILAIFRNIYIYFNNTKKPPILAAIIFSLSLILLSIPQIDGLMSIIPVIVVLMYSWSLFSNNMKIIKITIIIVDILSILYDYYVGAPVGVVADALSLILTAGSEIIYFTKKQKS